MVVLLDSYYTSLIVSLAIKFSDACIFVCKGAVQGNKFRLETGDRFIFEFI
ncbi:hypothetical protein [Nostoc sp.]|uniref:hypothetical protein n=1 Tax=Nostoc sp. TaxID=1180 RepID=UPI002FFC5783